MKLQDNIDFTALNWVKHELDATLKQGRDALEAYVENPSDVALMRESALHLHQVQGTLRMVELYGAAMVVEEMERLAQGLLDDTIKQRDEAYSVLMRGMVQLPDYLERVQSGHKDIPIVLLPLLNDLRACRGDNLLTESALFSPDMHAELPRAAIGSASPPAPAELRTQALRLRLAFQAALLKWFRDESANEHLDRLNNVLDRLRALSYGSEPRRLWWVAGGVIEAVREGALEPSVAVKLLFGGVDREIKRFADGGENALASPPPRDLVKNLLYYIAHSTAEGPRARDVRATYRLDTLLPTQKELQHAQGSMTGHNRNLLDTVSVAIKEDLLRVKESLDIFLRSQRREPGRSREPGRNPRSRRRHARHARSRHAAQSRRRTAHGHRGDVRQPPPDRRRRVARCRRRAALCRSVARRSHRAARRRRRKRADAKASSSFRRPKCARSSTR